MEGSGGVPGGLRGAHVRGGASGGATFGTISSLQVKILVPFIHVTPVTLLNNPQEVEQTWELQSKARF